MRVEHILLTSDLSEEALRAFGPVLEFAAEFGAKVSVLHVVQDVPIAPHGAPLAPPVSAPDLSKRIESARKALAEQCSDLQGKVQLHVIGHSDTARGVIDWAEENDVDLIALSTHGRTGFRRLALGSVAEAVLRRSTIPVLSFHRPE